MYALHGIGGTGPVEQTVDNDSQDNYGTNNRRRHVYDTDIHYLTKPLKINQSFLRMSGARKDQRHPREDAGPLSG